MRDEHKKSTEDVHEGLEGIVATRTAMSEVDGARGALTVAGHPIESLAFEVGFESLAGRLWTGRWPEGGDEQRAWSARLGQARRQAFDALVGPGASRALVLTTDAMDALRAAVGAMEAGWAYGDDRAGQIDDACAVTAALPVVLAAWWRRRQGMEAVAPDPDLGHAADLLRMLRGEAPGEAEARALEAYLVTVSDHGMNASTFTARVIASTQSDVVSAITGAIGALKGPLHGGAPGPVLDMLDAIGAPELAEAWIRAEVSAGRRIMGMGHRVYKVRDPRAEVFEKASQRLLEASPDGSPVAARLELARAVEGAAQRVLEEVKPGRHLRANVEFYTAVLLEAVGVPRELFSPTFATGRVIGWAGHVLEQSREGRLIRPSSHYVGPKP